MFFGRVYLLTVAFWAPALPAQVVVGAVLALLPLSAMWLRDLKFPVVCALGGRCVLLCPFSSSAPSKARWHGGRACLSALVATCQA